MTHLFRAKFYLLAALLIISPLAMASNWVPIINGGITIVIPSPKMDNVTVSFGSEPATLDANFTGLTNATQLYYRFQTNEPTGWSNTTWQCVDLTNNPKAEHIQTITNVSAKPYRVEAAVVMNESVCNTTEFASQNLVSSTVISSNTVEVPAAPILNMAWKHNVINPSEDAELYWNAVNANECYLGENTTGIKLAVEGRMTFSDLARTQKTIYCTGAGGEAIKSLNITVAKIDTAPHWPFPTGNVDIIKENGESTNIYYFSWRLIGVNHCDVSISNGTPTTRWEGGIGSHYGRKKFITFNEVGEYFGTLDCFLDSERKRKAFVSKAQQDLLKLNWQISIHSAYPTGREPKISQRTAASFSWNPIPDASKYIVQRVACQKNCATLEQTDWSTGSFEEFGLTHQFSALATPSAFRVKACFPDNSCTPWSESIFYRQPVISGTPPPSVDIESSFSFTPIAYDADKDDYTFSIQNKPNWANFDRITGKLSGTPSLNDAGQYNNIVIRVSDGLFTSSLTFDITVNYVIDFDTPRLSKASRNSLQWTALPNAVSYHLQGATCEQSCTNWQTIQNTAKRTFENINGTTHNLAYRVKACTAVDGCSNWSNTVYFNQPTLTGTPATFANINQAYTFTPTVLDPDNDVLTFTINNKPDWANFATTSGTLSGHPPSTGQFDAIEISVTDGVFTKTLPAFDITAVNVADTPVLSKNNTHLKWNTVAFANYQFEAAVCQGECQEPYNTWQQISATEFEQTASTIQYPIPSDKIARAYRVKACFENNQCTLWSNVVTTQLLIDEVTADNAVEIFTHDSFETTNDNNDVILPTEGQGVVIGKTSGNFRIDEGGNATYHLPFDLPIGPGGIKPELGLMYSSGNTRINTAGIGWSLTGLSSIQRCNKNHYYEALDKLYTKPISFDDSDEFCINGQRLIRVSNDEYRLEVDNQTSYKISVLNGVISGFVATTKSGEKHYYGDISGVENNAVRSISSDLTNNVNVNFSWYLSRIEDTYGNTIDYLYKKPTINGVTNLEIRLDQIQYEHTNIKLEYTLPKIRFGFLHGNKITTSGVLNNILIQDENKNTYRFYELKYQDPIEKSYLDSIKECAGDFIYPGKCLEPINFTWEKDYPKIEDTDFQEVSLGKPEYNLTTFVADINGDGYSDFIYYQGDEGFQVNYGNNLGNGLVSISDAAKIGRHELDTLKISDFNGDGRQDFIVKDNENSWFVIYNKPINDTTYNCHPLEAATSCQKTIGKGELKTQTLPGLKGVSSKLYLSDFNGDGVMDLVKVNGNYLKGHQVNIEDTDSISFSEATVLYDLNNISSPFNPEPARKEYIDRHFYTKFNDFNGDGLTDALVFSTLIETACDDGIECRDIEKGTAIHLLINDGDFYELNTKVFDNITGPDSTLHASLTPKDLNSDGLVDLITKNDHDRYFVLFSNGSGFEDPLLINNGKILDKKDITLDFDINGDSIPEVLVYDKEQKHWEVNELQLNLDTISFENTGLTINIERKDTDTITIADRNGNGYPELVRIRYENSGVKAHLFSEKSTYRKQNVIKEFYHDIGTKTRVEYKPLTDETVYLGGLEAKHPFINVVNPMYVVSSVHSGDGIGGELSVEYQYANLALHAEGKGYLGFGKLITLDKNDPAYTVRTTTLYHQGFVHTAPVMNQMFLPNRIGLPISTTKEIETNLGNIITLSEAVNNYFHADVLDAANTKSKVDVTYVYPNQVTEKSYHLTQDSNDNFISSELLNTTVTTNKYDEYGNVLESKVDVIQGNETYTTLTENKYTANTDCFGYNPALVHDFEGDYLRFGRLSCSRVTKIRKKGENVESAAKIAAFAYDENGVLHQEISNLQSNDLQLKTEYKFDAKGNTEKKITTGKQAKAELLINEPPKYSGQITVKEEYGYDPTKRFLVSKTNNLDYKECYSVDPLTGRIMSKTTGVLSCEDSGLTTYYAYNAIGQLTGERAPDGTVKRIERKKEHTETKYTYSETVTVSGGLEKITYFDKLGREISTEQETHADLDTKRKQYTEYDKLGRVYRQSIDVENEPTDDQYHVTRYDLLGRITSKTTPSFEGELLTVDYTYGVNTVTEKQTAPGLVSKSTTRYYNPLGEVIRVTENEGTNFEVSVNYTYNPYGQLKTSNINDSNTITITYDVLGNKVQTIDPDKGTWNYRYNAFGQLKWQKDAKGQVTWIDYDGLGRVSKRIDGAQSSSSQSRCFTYDSLLPLGAIDSEYVSEGKTCQQSSAKFEKAYLYDELGRLETVKTYITKNNKSHSQVNKQFYDRLGRVYLKQISNYFALGYQYSESGLITHTYGLTYSPNTESITRTLLQETNSVNYRGQVKQISYLEGQTINYGYDETTGLSNGMWTSGINNHDVTGNINTTYNYNAFGQLTSRDTDGLYGATRTEEFTYDKLNRLESQTVLFNGANVIRYYCYDLHGNMLAKGTVDSCDSAPAQFVYGESGAGPHALTTNKLTKQTYQYDSNGNMFNDGKRRFTYSAFDKVISASEASNMKVDFAYDTNHQRYYRKDDFLSGSSEANKVDTETFYFGNFERIVKSDKSSLMYRHVIGNLIFEIDLVTGNTKHSLQIKDHLGSIIAISNQNSEVINAFYYEPFGKQVAVTPNGESAFTDYLRQGYTGHEMINGLNFIHMNGRIYDPTLGRFLQADPHIQAPHNSQNYNRYSYVLNNPMSYTDPSGYFFKAIGKFVKKYWKTIVQIGITVMTAGAGLAWAIAGGALSGYVATGSLKGALVGAFSGALFYGAGEIIANNGIQNILGKGLIRGMAGGISSVLSGGKFGHGFAAAGVSSMAGGKIDAAFKDTGARVVAAAVVGGTVSQVTGGKFANGAITAAFMKAYNDANHPKFEHPDAPLAKWFKSIADGAAQLRNNIEGALSDLGNSISNALTTTADSTANAARIAYNNPSKTLAAGGSFIGGAMACMKVVTCPAGVVMMGYGVDQTHALVNGNNMTTSQQYLGDVLSHPDARAAFPFIENPHNAAGTIIDISTFATGGAGASTLNLYNGTGNTMDVINAINDANTLKNY